MKQINVEKDVNGFKLPALLTYIGLGIRLMYFYIWLPEWIGQKQFAQMIEASPGRNHLYCEDYPSVRLGHLLQNRSWLNLLLQW